MSYEAEAKQQRDVGPGNSEERGVQEGWCGRGKQCEMGMEGRPEGSGDKRVAREGGGLLRSRGEGVGGGRPSPPQKQGGSCFRALSRASHTP